MDTIHFIPAKTDGDIQTIAHIAEEIWHQHFTPIIGEEQVIYMVDKFQSYPALTEQIRHNGYEYFLVTLPDGPCGYIGIHQEENALFLSKLYLKKEARGRHLATKGIDFLVSLCKERQLSKIWLTCNKHNDHTLAIYDHLGFQITDEQVADIGSGFVMDDYILTYYIKKDNEV